MMGIRMGTVGLALALFIIMASAAFSQWPSNPAVNLPLSVTTGEATITHIATTSDGGCYVSWWDNTPGHYCMYLQRLNSNGEIMWAPNGLLISNHAQDTWLTDYSLTVDSTDCAILAINDLRAGGDWDIYAYRINAAGEFLWGADGLTISNNAQSEAFPQALVTSGGNIVFGWSNLDSGVIYLRKVNPLGVDQWTPPTKTISGTYDVVFPRLAAAEDDGFIMQLLVHQGTGYAAYYMYAHKYNSLGADQWGANGVLINNAASVPIYSAPDIISDQAGGAFPFWYDARGNVLHVYAQHISSAGAMLWTANGVVVSTTAGQIQVGPTCIYHPATSDLMLFYVNKNSDQTIIGLYGQKLNLSGARQWTNGGRAFVSMAPEDKMLINTCPIQNDAIVLYLENPPGDFANTTLKAMRVDGGGNQVWLGSPRTIASTISSKGYLKAQINQFGQAIAVWQDKRTDPDGDAYLQNINADGTLGPLPVSDGMIAGTVFGPDSFYTMVNVIVSTYDSLNTLVGVDTTNYHGQYAISMPPGLYHETFSRWGYNNLTIDNIRVIDDSTTNVTAYMSFSPGCHYVVGDVNNNGVFNTVDIVFAVTILLGGPLPPYLCECPPGHIWAVAGDVNASCTFNGVDVTYMAAYIKGGQPLHPCPNCPPQP